MGGPECEATSYYIKATLAACALFLCSFATGGGGGGGGVRLLGEEVNSATMNCRSFVSMYTSVTFHVTNQVEYSSGSLLSIIPNK